MRPFLFVLMGCCALLAQQPQAASSQAPSDRVATGVEPASKAKSTATEKEKQEVKPPDLNVPPPPNLPITVPSYTQPPLPLLIAPRPPLPPPPANFANGPPLTIQSASEIIKVVLGLVFLFGLAYFAGSAQVQAIERRLQVSSVVTAGLPFVFLGVIAHTRWVGILSESVLWELRPLLALGLGWIGFTAGFRFDSKLGESILPGTSTVSMMTASIPFATIVAASALLLVFVEHSPANAIFLRDAMMLATAGAMTAYNAPKFLQQSTGIAWHYIERVASIVTLQQLAGFIGLLIVAAYFRPQDNTVAWRLPGTAWLFITIGMGTMIGGVVWGMLSRVKAGPEFTVLILGSVCFTAGMASYLRISPLVVCFIVGLILVNLPGTSKERIKDTLEHMERPVYLLFLLVAGSLWDVTQWQGWALLLLFVPARLFGKWLGLKLCPRDVTRSLSREEKRSLILSPMGALSIAIIVNAQDLYFGSTISWMVTAVIGGAIVTEVILQIASRRSLIGEQALSGVA